MGYARDVAAAAVGLFVVETVDADAYLGHLEFKLGAVAVRNGLVGRPHVIAQEDVWSICPAEDHPDVVGP